MKKDHYTATQLSQIFSPFRDRYTDSHLEDRESGPKITFVRNGYNYIIFHDLEENNPFKLEKDGKLSEYENLHSMLSDENFANIGKLARTQIRMFKKEKQDGKFDPDLLIDPVADLDGKRVDMMHLRNELAPRGSLDHVAITIIDGPAGIGKTSLVKRLVYERAEAFVTGNDVAPILHVVKRAGNLQEIDELVAYALQVNDADFRFDQVPILVSLGLIQLSIDGFDELADPSGYKNAWRSLQDTIENISTGGPILLSGRDTFFDSQDFEQSLNSRNVNLRKLRLQTVDQNTARRYLKDNAWSDDELSNLADNSVLSEGAYSLRPYFLHVLATMKTKTWRSIEESRSGPRFFLIHEFMRREYSIIERSILNTQKNEYDPDSVMEAFLGEVAVEMARSAADVLEVDYLQELAILRWDGMLDPRDVASLAMKVSSFGLLERDETSDRLRRFTHSEVYNYFLSVGLVREVALDDSAAIALRRATLQTGFLRCFIDYFNFIQTDVATKFALKIAEARVGEPFGHFGRNLSSIQIAMMGREDVCKGTAQRLRSAEVDECTIPPNPGDAEFIDFSAIRMDARGANLSSILFCGASVVSTLQIDPTTRLSANMPTVMHLESHTPSGVFHERDPEIISKMFRQPEDPLEGIDFESAGAKLLDSLCRHFLSHGYLKLHEDDVQARRYLQNPVFTDVTSILDDEGILKNHGNLGGGGTPADFISVREPMKILSVSDLDEQGIRIWKLVSKL